MGAFTKVQVAVTAARRAMRQYKSDNKFGIEWDDARIERYKRAHELLSGERAALREPIDFRQIKRCARWAMSQGAGNCQEGACIAFSHLKWEGVGPIELATVDSPDFPLASHMFVVVKRPLGQSSLNEDGLATLKGASVYIADPWANIACRADEYYHRWEIKLLEWHSEGKMFPAGFDGDGTPMRALEYYFNQAHWINLVRQSISIRFREG
jgi:hypothetical protein